MGRVLQDEQSSICVLLEELPQENYFVFACGLGKALDPSDSLSTRPAAVSLEEEKDSLPPEPSPSALAREKTHDF